MSSRLALKYGLVSEEDRLSNSSDAVLVTEPTTGSKARTKGSLYLVVTSKTLGGKTRDACRLVADTIRREYYYDESAGIAIVLEKAIRAANRRLRHSREGGGLNQGSVGLAVAVVRGNELYVATCGDADSYLIRAARLLMPEHEPGEGLPAPDNVRIDVWKGDFAVGDSLVLCSRNLVEVVGTEELKNAVVTLHPQSAVEHLHHLFVAAGGEGSDAVLTIEATEVSLNRVEHKLVPVSPSEPLAGAPDRSPIPLADSISGAATAISDKAVAARLAVRDSFSRVVGGVLDLTPRRGTSYRRVGGTAATRRETQRRAAIAVLAFIAVVAVLGVAVVVLDPFRQEAPISNVTEGEAALTDARQKADEVFGSADLMNTNPTQAQELLSAAWAALDRAEDSGVVDQDAIDTQRGRVSAGLEQLYGTIEVSPAQVYAAQESTALRAARARAGRRFVHDCRQFSVAHRPRNGRGGHDRARRRRRWRRTCHAEAACHRWAGPAHPRRRRRAVALAAVGRRSAAALSVRSAWQATSSGARTSSILRRSRSMPTRACIAYTCLTHRAARYCATTRLPTAAASQPRLRTS